MFSHTMNKITKVCPFVPPTSNEDDLFIKRLKGLDGGIGIGCLGIVVERHSLNRIDVLKPVLQSFELSQTRFNLQRLKPQNSAHTNSSKGIFQIVSTDDLQL